MKLQARTVYNNTISIASLFTVEAMITKYAFPAFEEVSMRIQT